MNPVPERPGPPPTLLPEDTDQTFRPDRTAIIKQLFEPLQNTVVDRPQLFLSRSLTPQPTETDEASQTDEAAYRFIRVVGRGGSGEVWESIQTSLNRLVAVKRLRPDIVAMGEVDGTSSKSLAKSFRHEALTSAILDHPNIVPVYDMGVDEKGFPLLAMKLVKGTPWNKLLVEDHKTLSENELLAKHLPILIDVSQAVAYAHRRGIVHRDLKPSQVMVGEFGEVLLMDWGLAIVFSEEALRPFEGVETTKVAPSIESAVNPAGTPAYMAPEQTESTAARVGPWTDVYLLGGTLYYILTGRPPHDGDDPVIVFTRAQFGDVTPPAHAAPGRQIPAELAAIAMKAMTPECEHRYGTVQEFMAALQAYLSGANRQRESVAIVSETRARLSTASSDYRKLNESLTDLDKARVLWPENPEIDTHRDNGLEAWARAAIENRDLVLARLQAERISDSTTREKLFSDIAVGEARIAAHARQRRGFIAASVALAAVLLIGGAFYSWNLNSARDEALDRRREADFQRDRAFALQEEAEQERDKVRQEREESEALLSFMLNDLRTRLAHVDPSLKSLDVVADRAMTHIKSRDISRLGQEEFHGYIRSLIGVGDVYSEQGNQQQSMESYEKGLEAIELHRESASGDPVVAALEANLHNCMAGELVKIGRVDEAFFHSRRAHDIIKPLYEKNPRNDEYLMLYRAAQNHAGDILSSRGQMEEAMAHYNEIEQTMLAAGSLDSFTFEQKRTFAGALSDKSRLLRFQGKIPEAMEGYNKATEILDALCAELPDDSGLAANALIIRPNIAWCLRAQGKVEESLSKLEESILLYQVAVQRFPTNLSIRSGLADCQLMVGHQYRESGRKEDSQRLAHEARENSALLVARNSENETWCMHLSSAYLLEGILVSDDSDFEGAVKLFRESARALEPSVNRNPSNIDMLREYSAVISWIGGTLGAMGRAAEAREENRHMLDLIAKASSQTDLQKNYIVDLQNLRMQFLEQLYDAGDESVIAEMEQAVATVQKMCDENPDQVQWSETLMEVLANMARIYQDRAESGKVIELRTREMNLSRQLQKTMPSNVRLLDHEASALNGIGLMTLGDGDAVKALEYFQQELALRERLVEAKQGESFARGYLGTVHIRIGSCYLDQNRYTEALDEFRKGRAVAEELATAYPDQLGKKRDVLVALSWESGLLAKTQRFAEAAEVLTESLRLVDELIVIDPESATYRMDRAQLLRSRADSWLKTQSFDDARRDLDESLKLVEDFLVKSPTDNSRIAQLGAVYLGFAQLARLQDDLPGAKLQIDKSLEKYKLAMNDPASAKQHERRNAVAQCELVQILIGQGNGTEACALLDNQITPVLLSGGKKPGQLNTESREALILAQAACFDHSGNGDEAFKLLENAVSEGYIRSTVILEKSSCGNIRDSEPARWKALIQAASVPATGNPLPKSAE